MVFLLLLLGTPISSQPPCVRTRHYSFSAVQVKSSADITPEIEHDYRLYKVNLNMHSSDFFLSLVLPPR